MDSLQATQRLLSEGTHLCQLLMSCPQVYIVILGSLTLLSYNTNQRNDCCRASEVRMRAGSSLVFVIGSASFWTTLTLTHLGRIARLMDIPLDLLRIKILQTQRETHTAKAKAEDFVRGCLAVCLLLLHPSSCNRFHLFTRNLEPQKK